MSSKKREILPLPANLTPASHVCFQMVLPNDPAHFAAFWGAVQALSHRYTWGKPLTADSEIVATYWRNLIEENRVCFERALDMANNGCGCCPDPVYRYTPDGVRQRSDDNGETWVDDLSDPRVSGSILPPPPWLLLPGGHSCEGAITGRLNMENAISEILTTGVDAGFTSLVSIIIGVICAITAGVACAVAGIIGSMVTIIVQIGADIIEAAMTAEVYDTFQCILYCRISDTAEFTDAAWQGVKNDIAEQLSGDAEMMLWNMVNAMGPVGLTNLCRASIAVAGNCDDCVCDPCSDVVAVLGTVEDHPDEFTWVLSSADDGFGQQAIIIQFGTGGIDQCCCLQNVTIEGFAPFEFYRACGDPDQVGGNPGSSPIWEYRRGTGVGGAAFGMTVVVETCPE